MSEIIAPFLIGAAVSSMLSFVFVTSDIQPSSWQHAEKLCENNEGVDYISEGLTNQVGVTCINGAKFTYYLNTLEEV